MTLLQAAVGRVGATEGGAEALGSTIYAASVDTLEQEMEMANGAQLTLPVACGVTEEDARLLGAWWSEDRGGYIQPAEFLLGRGGIVLGSMYASGPVGRMGADEAVRQITNRERRRREQEYAELADGVT